VGGTGGHFVGGEGRYAHKGIRITKRAENHQITIGEKTWCAEVVKVDTAERTEGYTLLAMLESRSDDDVAALDTDNKVCEMALLFDALVEQAAQHRAAEAHLRAAQHHQHMAYKHEDVDEIAGATAIIDHLERVVPLYTNRLLRLHQQWSRYWSALLCHRIPDELYEALLAIAEAEGRTLTEQMVVMLDEAVAQWQGQQGGL
jgi:hypothetical protein